MLKHLIVQLPGIGGSVLARDGVPVWDVRPWPLARAVVNPVRLQGDDLVPWGLVNTMTVIPGLVAIPGYDRMIGHLRRWCRAPDLKVVTYRPGVQVPADVDVLQVPYDFRRSVVDGAETVARALHGLDAADRGVIVLAHSLGGLVARYWAAHLDPQRRCVRVITLGTPHRGAPKALDVLANGLGVGRLRHPGATRVVRQWPSVYELLPHYPSVMGVDGPIEPVQLAAECVRPFGDPAAGASFVSRTRDSAIVHDDLAAAWRDQGPDRQLAATVPFYARGHATPNRAELTGNRVKVSKADPPWRGNVGWRGDGTVPMISAIPPELGEVAEQWHPAVDKHGSLAGTAAVRDLLLSLLGQTLPMRGGDAPDKPWIGFDLDDTVWAGDEIVIAAQALGDVHNPGTHATVRIANDPIPMEFRDGSWHTVLDGLAPGTYEVTVEIAGATQGGPVWGSAPLVVAEPDTGWHTEDHPEDTEDTEDKVAP